MEYIFVNNEIEIKCSVEGGSNFDLIKFDNFVSRHESKVQGFKIIIKDWSIMYLASSSLCWKMLDLLHHIECFYPDLSLQIIWE